MVAEARGGEPGAGASMARALGADEGPLEAVAQLPDVAREPALREHREAVGQEVHRPAVLRGELPDPRLERVPLVPQDDVLELGVAVALERLLDEHRDDADGPAANGNHPGSRIAVAHQQSRRRGGSAQQRPVHPYLQPKAASAQHACRVVQADRDARIATLH